MDSFFLMKNEYSWIFSFLLLGTMIWSAWLVKYKDKRKNKLIILMLKTLAYYSLCILAIAFDQDGFSMNPVSLSIGQISLSVISMLEGTDNFTEFMRLINKKEGNSLNNNNKDKSSKKRIRYFPILLVLLPALYFGYVGKSAEMGLSIISGAVTYVLMNTTTFKMIKVLGFKAKMWKRKKSKGKKNKHKKNKKNLSAEAETPTGHKEAPTAR